MASLLKLARRVLLRNFAGNSAHAETDAKNVDEVILTNVLGPFESYFVMVQSILIWEKPLRSTAVLILVNVIFWLAVSCNCRFYFAVAVSLACVHLYRTWTHQIWPEIRVPIPEGEDSEDWTPVNPQVLSVPEISRYVGRLAGSGTWWRSWFMDMRHDQPGMFCVLVTCALSALGLIGCYISGAFLVYLAVMAVMVGPGLVVHVTPMTLHNFLNVEWTRVEATSCEADDDKDGDDLDDFLPEANHEMLDLLTRAMNLQHLDDDSIMVSQEFGLDYLVPNDSEDVSLQAGLGEIPAHDHVDSDDDEQDFTDGSSAAVPATAATLPLPASMTRPETEIRFFPSYLDEDSEEEAMAAGLSFEEESARRRSAETEVASHLAAPTAGEPDRTSKAETGAAAAAAAASNRNRPTVDEANGRFVPRKNSASSDTTDTSDYEIVSDSELS